MNVTYRWQRSEEGERRDDSSHQMLTAHIRAGAPDYAKSQIHRWKDERKRQNFTQYGAWEDVRSLLA